MKTAGIGILVVGMTAFTAVAEKIYFDGVSAAQITTGDLLDGADHLGLTTNVVEVSGLNITAWSGGTNQVVKTLVDSMGINRDQDAPEHIRLDNAESLTIAFDRDVKINRLDFNHFDDGESMTVSFENMFDLTFAWSNLSNQISDYLNTNIIVSAGTKITYSVGTTNSIIGLDGIDLELTDVADAVVLNLMSSNNTINLSVEFNEPPVSNCVLQWSTNLTTNVWNSVGGTFSSNTNWLFDIDKDAQFFRIIEQ